MDKRILLLISACLPLLAAGCRSTITINGDVREMPGFETVESMSPREFFAVRMKNNKLSIFAWTKVFEIIQETDDHVLAGYITLGDIEDKRNRYSKIVKIDKRKLMEEFPLYRTFTASIASQIISREDKKHSPFFVYRYHNYSRRRPVGDDYLSHTHMIFTTSYEYSRNHGPWQRYKMVVKINKTDITDVSSERVE